MGHAVTAGRGASIKPGVGMRPLEWSIPSWPRGMAGGSPGHPSWEGFWRPCCCLQLGHGCGSLRAAASWWSLLRPARRCPVSISAGSCAIAVASLRGVRMNCTLIISGWSRSTLGHSVHFCLPDALAATASEGLAAGQSRRSKRSPSHTAEVCPSGCACVLETFPASICLISCGEGKGFAR